MLVIELRNGHRCDGSPYVRWWWLAGPFRFEDIEYQLEWVKTNGFGGVEIAWLWPRWLNKAPGVEWLSDEWSDLVTFTKDTADWLGLGCDFTFGSCWPFGSAQLDPSFALQTLWGPARQRLHGSWEPDAQAPHVLNHLSMKSLEAYADLLEPAFQGGLSGAPSALFCDSLEFDEELWDSSLWDRFFQEHGYRLESFVRELDIRADVRFDYRSTVAKAFVREFFEPFTRICRERGTYARVQCHGALTDLLEAYASVDVPESEAILFNPPFSRIASSAAALAERRVVSCETFTCIYGFPSSVGRFAPPPDARNFWKRELVSDLKLLADAVLAEGVNRIVWHGMPYNPPGASIEFFTSVHVGPDSALADELTAFNAYLRRTCDILQTGRTFSDLAVYFPLEDAWMADKIPHEARTPGAVSKWEMRHADMPLAIRGFNPLWISEPFLQQAIVSDGKLRIGDQAFHALWVDAKWITRAAIIQILRLANDGLPIVMPRTPRQPGHRLSDDYGDLLKQLQSLPTASRSLAELNIQPIVEGSELPPFWARQIDDSLWLFFAHPFSRNLRYPMTYAQSVTKSVCHRKIRVRWRNRVSTVRIGFRRAESFFVCVRPDGRAELMETNYCPWEDRATWLTTLVQRLWPG